MPLCLILSFFLNKCDELGEKDTIFAQSNDHFTNPLK